jgi:nitroreductase
MEFRDLVESRVSVRQFSAEPVPPADIREMVRLAGLAPSPNNSQPWQFIAVARPSLLKAMGEAVAVKVRAMLGEAGSDEARHARQRVEWFSTFFADAPVVIAAVLLPYEAVVDAALESTRLTGPQVNAMRGQPDVQSLGAAVEHLLLAAANLGYGGCWLSGPLVARDALERVLGIRPPGRLAAMVAIGRPATAATPHRERKALADILTVVE